MPNYVPSTAGPLSLPGRTERSAWGGRKDRWAALAESAILVLGSPRSGTSWLAKIFDSHPDVLYRHEPDELTAEHGHPRAQLVAWIRERGLRASAKRPWFRKSWRPQALEVARQGLAASFAAAQRLQPAASLTGRLGLPDLVVPSEWHRVRAAVKLVNRDGSVVAQTMPRTRCVFILRHPCGQVASVKTGHAAGKFADQRAEDSERQALAPAKAWAIRHGLGEQAFDLLPPAARYAWAWRAFNEAAVAAMAALPNVRVVLYEELCSDPAQTMRALFAFTGLSWTAQTEAFLADSTGHHGSTGYYDVFRSTVTVPDRWRTTMPAADQEAVRDVVSSSSLASFWPDLTAG